MRHEILARVLFWVTVGMDRLEKRIHRARLAVWNRAGKSAVKAAEGRTDGPLHAIRLTGYKGGCHDR